MDHAAGPLFSTYDPGGRRIELLSSLVRSALARPGIELAVIRLRRAGGALRPGSCRGPFTRNPGVLLAAITRLALPSGCLGEDQCRDYDDALRAAEGLIEDDVARTPAGERVLTQYVVLLVNAGRPSRWRRGRTAARGGPRLPAAGDAPDAACQLDRDVARVASLRATAAAAGATLRLHTLHLAAEPAEEADRVARVMDRMAFAGAGRSLRFGAVTGVDLGDLALFDREGALRAQRLVVANINALPGPDGPIPDSDGDGLSDDEEVALHTAPDRADTDGDGVGDRVEVLAGLDPQVAETPAICAALATPARMPTRTG
ncbi:MAG: thrombospondin type 3 repeat-containing protein [bacterium]